MKPTIIYEDNSACIVQMNACYIKSNITKHIAPKLFYPHKLQKNREIEILQIKSYDNLAYLFTKSLPNSLFQKYVFVIDNIAGVYMWSICIPCILPNERFLSSLGTGCLHRQRTYRGNWL